jgi:phosphonate transport system substrate-binding protein
LLLEEQHMQPERDYSWYYTYGHPESLAAVSTKHADAAPVASDIMARLASKNVIDLSKLRVISESERFPPVAFGYSYNLAPEVSDTIQATLLGFDWASTTLAKEFGADGSTKFVPVNYKDDWANIRRVDQAVAAERDAIRAR